MRDHKRSMLATTAIPRPVKRLAPPAGVSVGDEFTVSGESGSWRVNNIEPERIRITRIDPDPVDWCRFEGTPLGFQRTVEMTREEAERIYGK